MACGMLGDVRVTYVLGVLGRVGVDGDDALGAVLGG